jgi:hypothetical protein
MFGGLKIFNDWLVILTDCFLSIISIMFVLNTIRKITARVGKTAAFTNRDLDFGTYHVTILMLFIYPNGKLWHHL